MGTARDDEQQRELLRCSTGGEAGDAPATAAPGHGAPPDGPAPDEPDLVRRATGGDVDAYARLLRAHQGAARRLAAVVGGPADADEITQDAFVRAWERLDTFRPDARFRPWLLRIVANEASNRRRAAGRRAGHEGRFAADPTSAAPVPSPESALVSTAGHRVLLDAVAALPDHERDVVTCRYVVGLDEAETAVTLGVPRGTVKSRASRGLARLRTALAAAERSAPDG